MTIVNESTNNHDHPCPAICTSFILGVTLKCDEEYGHELPHNKVYYEEYEDDDETIRIRLAHTHWTVDDTPLVDGDPIKYHYEDGATERKPMPAEGLVPVDERPFVVRDDGIIPE